MKAKGYTTVTCCEIRELTDKEKLENAIYDVRRLEQRMGYIENFITIIGIIVLLIATFK